MPSTLLLVSFFYSFPEQHKDFSGQIRTFCMVRKAGKVSYDWFGNNWKVFVLVSINGHHTSTVFSWNEKNAKNPEERLVFLDLLFFINIIILINWITRRVTVNDIHRFCSITVDSEHVSLAFCDLFRLLWCRWIMFISWWPRLLQPIPTLQF